MSVRCRYCGSDYDVTLFEFGRSITCSCGMTVEFRHEESGQSSLSDVRAEDIKVREIGRTADRICSLIISLGCSAPGIEMEKRKLRERIAELFPDRTHMYELVYEPRFKRLEEQFGQ